LTVEVLFAAYICVEGLVILARFEVVLVVFVEKANRPNSVLRQIRLLDLPQVHAESGLKAQSLDTLDLKKTDTLLQSKF